MKTIHLTYYALLREERGLDQETIETEEKTVQGLYRHLQKKYNFRLTTDSLKVSINDEFTSWSAGLTEGDRVVFIPPVAGG